METMPYLLHALSPLHAGTGHAAGVIDLPIARMRSTGIPIVPGSSVKGVLRHARLARAGRGTDEDRIFAVFGPKTDDAKKHAGALVVGDARLLALPVRSFRGTFAWVSSPLLLELARRDAAGSGVLPDTVPAMNGRGALVGSIDPKSGSLNVHGEGASMRVFLEDLDLTVAADATVHAWGERLSPLVSPDGAPLAFRRRFAVVDDETMTFLWETATQIDTRVRLDPDTRTVATGALWVEESLPPETVLFGLLAAEPSRRCNVLLKAAEVLEIALADAISLQFGGNATVGRGRCRMMRLRGAA